ncbi:MAG: DUF1549 domain-containing protein [Planctomyces sp.]|nr:DUF1549 domain-containing protein [Planctomyces sp.]
MRTVATPVRAMIAAALLVSSAGAAQKSSTFTTGSNDPVIQKINEFIRTGWEENEVRPSPVADDAEWLRRVSLDLVGQIPDSATVEAFLADKDPAKRSALIERLLEDPRHVRNQTTVWANILVGRNAPDRTSRPGLEKFLRESFARNRPWNEIVFDLMTAEGHFEENGAVNFLLGQLQGNPNDEEYAVEATARATRILLGMQVQCTQCHDHPFNDWKQNQFWEFNSFLRQVRRRDVDRYDAASGQMVDDYSELVRRDYQGPVYFETRQGLMKVAYPKYFEQELESRGQTDRRQQLADLMAKNDPNHQVARAFVNRMWGHYFGYGFTRPVDDMGPHNPPSHPELLDWLTEEFVRSGYDIKQLTRWITNSEAYNLTSQFNPGNEIDNPSVGETPLFSRMYVKTLTVEQLYESLLIATNAEQSGQVGYEEAQRQRREWTRDFMRIFGGNDDDEPTLFSGTIPQALLLMNGDLVRQATSVESGGFLAAVLNSPRFKSDAARVQALYVSALGRIPSRVEYGKIEKVMKLNPNRAAAYQDLYWALLNSNEFVLNH